MDYINKLKQSETIRNNLAYILMFISQFGWPISWIFNNEHNVNFLQSAFCRGFIFILLNFFAMTYRGEPFDYKDKTAFRYLFIRSVLMVIHLLIMGLSQFILPLPIVHTINVCGIIFVFIIDYYLNGIEIVRQQLYGIIIAIVGVFITANNRQLNGLIYPDHQYETNFENYLTQDPFLQTIMALVLIINNIGWAFGIVLTKRIKLSTFQVNFLFGMFNLYVGALFMPFVPSQTTISTLLWSMVCSSLILGLSAWSFIASFSLTKNTGTLSMFCILPMAVGEVFSAVKYKQSQNPFIFIGIAALVVGVFKTIFNKKQ